MALGFGFKTEKADSNGDAHNGSDKVPVDLYDPENLVIGGKRMNRIDGPMKRRNSTAGDDSSADLTVGKQIEMESENAIQYRTCSWPKVCFLAMRL